MMKIRWKKAEEIQQGEKIILGVAIMSGFTIGVVACAIAPHAWLPHAVIIAVGWSILVGSLITF